MIQINNAGERQDVIDRREAARILGVSVSQVERFRRQKKLPHIKLSRKCVRYRRSDCERLLTACTIGRRGSEN